MKTILTTTLFFVLLFTGCSQKEPIKLETLPISKAKVKKIDFKDIQGFYEDDLNYAFEVFKKKIVKEQKDINYLKIFVKKQTLIQMLLSFLLLILLLMNYIAKQIVTKV